MPSRFAIDVGNSKTKLFRLPNVPHEEFDGDFVAWVNSVSDHPESLEQLTRECGQDGRIDIVSTRPEASTAMAQDLSKKVAHVCHWVSATLPIKNAYTNDATLGPDRPLAAYAAFQEFKCPIVVVDVGTALTVDLVDGKGDFLGGAIAPGLTTIEQALGDSGAMLHKVDSSSIPYPGESTEDCLKIGAYEVFVGGLQRLVSLALAKAPDAKVLVTGGGTSTAMRVLAQHKPISRPLLQIGLAFLSWLPGPMKHD